MLERGEIARLAALRRSFPMISLLRAGVAAALLAVAPLVVPQAAGAAVQKAFQNSELAESAIALEAQIKSDAGTPTKPLPQIRRDADAAFSKNDFRSGMALLGQIVAAAPNDSATWLRLARTVMQIRPADDSEKQLLLERASTAAYIAYQRTTSRAEEADSLALLGNVLAQRELWRPSLDALRLSLELRETADVRGQYERLREEHGFRVLDYSVDADTASPRACFQFSEDLPPRTDFSPFVALAGTDKPALSAAEKQLCVEGLQHGESYSVTLRAGLPSTVHENLSKSADFTIYVRDRKPAVHFSSTAYVLPRSGQRGIPVITTNTPCGRGRNLPAGRPQPGRHVGNENYGRGDFQRGLSRYDVEHSRNSRGVAVWKGELAIEAAPINADVTTAFPVDQAVGELKPGVYVMVAQPQELKSVDSFDSLATQWFIVSDLGLTAFSGNDGIHVFVNSLATHGSQERRRGAAPLARQRGAGDAPHRRGRSCAIRSGAGERRGRRGARAADGNRRTWRLRVPEPEGPAFDLTDRGVGGRPAPAGLDAFVYAERGVYRSGETAYLTALLRTAQGAAAADVPLTFVIERPDGVEFRRALVADQGLGGHSLDFARFRVRRRPAPGTCAPTPTRSAPPSARPRFWSRIMCRTGSNSI